MKKIKIINSLNKQILIPGLVLLAFVLLIFGFSFLMLGVYKNNHNYIYTAIAFIITSTCIYSCLIIYGLVYYFKKGR